MPVEKVTWLLGGHAEEGGRAAIRRSGELVRPVQWTFAVPYLAFLAAPRLISMLKETLLRVVPPRILREVPELPICAYFLLVAMSVLASRYAKPFEHA